jgi:hypothetical protein
LTVRQAEQALEEHDCELGKVKEEKCNGADGKGKGDPVNRNWETDNCQDVPPGVVLRSDPRSGHSAPGWGRSAGRGALWG